MKRLTTEQFIIKAKLIHGDKYDYSQVNYANSHHKIKIICKEHGIFKQKPYSHLNGKGCVDCSGKKKLTKEQFISKAKLIHGDKYDYSLVDYKNNKTKVKIICKDHDVFEQTPTHHLNGHGCLKCANNDMALSTIEFIIKARKVHDDRYDYSLVDYKTNEAKVKIICKEHGVFKQRPHNHLQEANCPKCQPLKSKGELKIEQHLKDNNIQFVNQKTFHNCKNKYVLPFDFYLPEFNILIEYDGKQHYQPIKYYGGDDGLKQRQYHDKIKTQYCKDNNIELIRIPYTEFKNINELLQRYLNS